MGGAGGQAEVPGYDVPETCARQRGQYDIGISMIRKVKGKTEISI
jgi:hypothetical protein